MLSSQDAKLSLIFIIVNTIVWRSCRIHHGLVVGVMMMYDGTISLMGDVDAKVEDGSTERVAF